MSLWWLAGILFVCLLAEGFFTGTELAVIHADRLKLRSKAQRGSAAAKLALRFQSDPGWFFSATLLGTNLSLVTASVCTTLFIIRRFGPDYESWALLLSPLLLVFGEIIPKSLYQHYANRWVYKIVHPIRFFGLLFYPVVFVLTKLNDTFVRGIAKDVKTPPPVTRSDLETISKSFARPHLAISKIFDLAEKRVSNIMTPLVEVTALPANTAREGALRAFDTSAHSRIPIFRERITDIIGVLHSIDFLFAGEENPVREIMRPAYFVPEEMPLDDLLLAMKRKGELLAVVVDEYGGASGIVTLEDVVEEIVGEIEDEYDRPSPLYYRIGKNRFLVNGRLPVAEANEKLKLGIPPGDYETVAGFLIHRMEHIPQNGETYSLGPLQFIVHVATEKAVQEIEVRVSPSVTEG